MLVAEETVSPRQQLSEGGCAGSLTLPRHDGGGLGSEKEVGGSLKRDSEEAKKDAGSSVSI